MYLNQTVALVSRLLVPNVRMLLAVQQNHSKVCLTFFGTASHYVHLFASNTEVCLTLLSAGIKHVYHTPSYEGLKRWVGGTHLCECMCGVQDNLHRNLTFLTFQGSNSGYLAAWHIYLLRHLIGL